MTHAIDVFEWSRTQLSADTPFVVLGKGPSFSLRHQHDLSGCQLVSLNHTVREQRVQIAHMIDIDVVEDCEDSLWDNCEWLIVPRRPHVNCRPTPLTLEDFVQTMPILARFAAAGRLLTYSLWSDRSDRRPVKVQGTFSGSVVVNLLGQLGVKHVRLLGRGWRDGLQHSVS